MRSNPFRFLAPMSLLCLLSLPRAAGAEGVSPLDVMRAGSDIGAQVQAKVLDPVLGEGRASVFAQARLEFSSAQRESRKLGKGQVTDEHRKAVDGSSSTVASQYSEQVKAEDAAATTLSVQLVELRLQIVHDERLPPAALAAAKQALLAVFKGSLKPEALEWVPAPFTKPGGRASPSTEPELEE